MTATPTASLTPTATPTPTAPPDLTVFSSAWVAGQDGFLYEKTIFLSNRTANVVPISYVVQGEDYYDFTFGYNTCPAALPSHGGCYYRVGSNVDGAQAFDIITTEVGDSGSPYSVPLVVP
jgi:hypothetical protein